MYENRQSYHRQLLIWVFRRNNKSLLKCGVSWYMCRVCGRRFSDTSWYNIQISYSTQLRSDVIVYHMNRGNSWRRYTMDSLSDKFLCNWQLKLKYKSQKYHLKMHTHRHISYYMPMCIPNNIQQNAQTQMSMIWPQSVVHIFHKVLINNHHNNWFWRKNNFLMSFIQWCWLDRE